MSPGIPFLISPSLPPQTIWESPTTSTKLLLGVFRRGLRGLTQPHQQVVSCSAVPSLERVVPSWGPIPNPLAPKNDPHHRRGVPSLPKLMRAGITATNHRPTPLLPCQSTLPFHPQFAAISAIFHPTLDPWPAINATYIIATTACSPLGGS